MKKAVIALVILALLFTSCAKKKEAEPKIEEKEAEPVIDEVNIPEVEPEIIEEDPTLTETSRLTGLPCTPETKAMRNVAVMINNNKQSYPQIGISNADIVVECLAEGGITRLMCVYDNIKNSDVIGSVRSSRDYYIEISDMFDALYVHAGGSPGAYTYLSNHDTENLDGVNMHNIPSGTYFRDKDRANKLGYEHSLMTTGNNIYDACEYKKYDLEESDSSQIFDFSEEEIVCDDSAINVKLPFSTYATSSFEYGEDDKLYYKSSFGSPHRDGNTGEVLTFTNIIILYTYEEVLDSEGRMRVDTVGSGEGKFITHGKSSDIKWERASGGKVKLTYSKTGENVILNKGKTYFSYFDKRYKNSVEIK